MNMQEIYDKAVNGLAAQGWKQAKQPSVKYPDNMMCAYRGQDGLKCALGQVIPDDKYSPELENKAGSCDEVAEALGLNPEERTREMTSFLDDLQEAHDGSSDLAMESAHMRLNLRAVGETYDLTWPAVLIEE